MFLQLHDGPQMASNRYPRIPDLRLPDALKISNRTILIQAVEEGGNLAIKEFKKLETGQDPVLDKLDEDVAPTTPDPGEVAPKMGAVEWAVIAAKVGKFLAKYGQLIYQGLKNFAKTVKLFRVNQEIDALYDMNMYNVQQLNEMTPKQIDNQLKIMTVDLLNANAKKGQELEALALTRFVQVYQQRKISLPFVDQRTMMLLGAGVLAFLFLSKK